MKNFIPILAILLLLSGCFEKKNYLSEEIRKFVPYKKNQKLTFVSNKGVTNVFRISKIRDSIFPDGLPPSNGEVLIVEAYREADSINEERYVEILAELAEYDNKKERIRFGLQFTNGGIGLTASFSKIKNRELITLKTRFNEYNDVIKLEIEYNPEPSEWQITEFYWSLTNGYVKLMQHNGTIWELK